jgi:biopolymer transport protein ExbD
MRRSWSIVLLTLERMVIVKAARDLTYGEITDLLGQLKEIGANPIALLSE